jgi:hypothetical protein
MLTPPALRRLLILLGLAAANALQLANGDARVFMVQAPCRDGAIARTTAVCMLDPSLAADASAAIVPSLDPTSPVYDPHTLSNLGSDLWQTAIVAWVGLMGAYVTQDTAATEAGDEPFSEAEEPFSAGNRRRQRRQLLRPFDDDDDDDDFFERL